jgi:hypothetical protein
MFKMTNEVIVTLDGLKGNQPPSAVAPVEPTIAPVTTEPSTGETASVDASSDATIGGDKDKEKDKTDGKDGKKDKSKKPELVYVNVSSHGRETTKMLYKENGKHPHVKVSINGIEHYVPCDVQTKIDPAIAEILGV